MNNLLPRKLSENSTFRSGQGAGQEKTAGARRYVEDFLEPSNAGLNENGIPGQPPRPLVLFLSLLFLAHILSGCDFIYRLLQKEGAEEKALLGEIIPFERNSKVEKVQKLLKLYGYKSGRVDGMMGVNTRNAIEAFQKDNDLEPSRFVDNKTWEWLNAFDEYDLVIDGELNIAAVQRALKEAGFDPGAVDGKMGRRTLAALKAFQQEEGLNPDGKVGFKTLQQLALYL